MSTSIWRQHLHVAPVWCPWPPSWYFALQRANLGTLGLVNSPKELQRSFLWPGHGNSFPPIDFLTPKASSIGQITFSYLLFTQGDRFTFSRDHPAATQRDLKQIWMLISAWNGNSRLLSEKYPLEKVFSCWASYLFIYLILELTQPLHDTRIYIIENL